MNVRIDGVETRVYHHTLALEPSMVGRLVLRNSVIELRPWNVAAELLAEVWAGGIAEIRGLNYPVVNLTVADFEVLRRACNGLASVGEKYVYVTFRSDPTITAKALYRSTFQTKREYEFVAQDLERQVAAAKEAVIRGDEVLVAKVADSTGRPGAGSTKEEKPPDYFHTLEEAAAYAKVTKRTIQNWKKREWLKVEQNGRKLRIARSDLDTCRLKR